MAYLLTWRWMFAYFFFPQFLVVVVFWWTDEVNGYLLS